LTTAKGWYAHLLKVGMSEGRDGWAVNILVKENVSVGLKDLVVEEVGVELRGCEGGEGGLRLRVRRVGGG
jgi:hypothetical protein